MSVLSKVDLYNQLYMDNAIRVSEMSYCKRKKVGCIILTPDNICFYGWNGTPSGFHNNCETKENNTRPEVLHAELNAISKITKSTLSSEGSVMYITLAPCIECAKIIIQSGISKVYYLNDYRDDSGLKLLSRKIKIVKMDDKIQ